jgi:hypothetical protein
MAASWGSTDVMGGVEELGERYAQNTLRGIFTLICFAMLYGSISVVHG